MTHFRPSFSAKQQKQLQTLVLRDAGVACMSLNRNMIFLASNKPAQNPSISVLRPEAWDLEARRLILAGGLGDATELINAEYAKLIEVCTQRPATSSGAKNIFNSVCPCAL